MFSIKQEHGFSEPRLDIDQCGLGPVTESESQLAVFQAAFELLLGDHVVLDVDGLAHSKRASAFMFCHWGFTSSITSASPGAAVMLMVRYSSISLPRTIAMSTRRFFARFSTVSLGALGRVSA